MGFHMSDLETIPVVRYLVCERGSFREDHEFYKFESADDFLTAMREKYPNKVFIMYAEVDA